MRERDGLRVLSTHGWMAALSFECAKRRSILAHHAMLHLTSNDIMLHMVGRPTALQVSTEPYGGTTLLTKHGNPQLPRQSISIQIQSVSMQSKKKK